MNGRDYSHAAKPAQMRPGLILSIMEGPAPFLQGEALGFLRGRQMRAAAGSAFGREAAVSPWAVAQIVLVSVILPLLAGIGLCFAGPGLAARLARPASIAGTVLLALALPPVLFKETREIWALVGNGVALALVAFTLIGLAIRHLLGGPEAENRAVLALATGTRHPGVAIAVAHLNFPGETAILAVVLYHLVIGAIVAIPYVKWSRARLAADGRPLS